MVPSSPPNIPLKLPARSNPNPGSSFPLYLPGLWSSSVLPLERLASSGVSPTVRKGIPVRVRRCIAGHVCPESRRRETDITRGRRREIDIMQRRRETNIRRRETDIMRGAHRGWTRPCARVGQVLGRRRKSAAFPTLLLPPSRRPHCPARRPWNSRQGAHHLLQGSPVKAQRSRAVRATENQRKNKGKWKINGKSTPCRPMSRGK